jgi:chromatin remodeling complex protein RSC6
MESLLQQQKSTGVLESNSPTLMPALPLLLSPHIFPWHILFLAQSNCVLRGRIIDSAKMEQQCYGEIKEYDRGGRPWALQNT